MKTRFKCPECHVHDVTHKCKDCGKLYCDKCAEWENYRCDCIVPLEKNIKKINDGEKNGS